MEQPFYWDTKYLFMIVIILFCIRFYMKSKSSSREAARDRIWKKIAFAFQDLLPQLNENDKELLKHTYHNTIFNAKPCIIRDSQVNKKSNSQKKVSFELDKNVTHPIPKFDKDAQFE
ncbi:hypothetical protein pb186bvf_013986 [Paramecium bursaria]